MPTIHLLLSLLLATGSLALAELSPDASNVNLSNTTGTAATTVTVPSSPLPPYPTVPYAPSGTQYANPTAGAGGVPYNNGTIGGGGAGGGVASPTPTAGVTAPLTGSAVQNKILGACAALVAVCGGMLAL